MNATPARSDTHVPKCSETAAAGVTNAGNDERVLALLEQFLQAHRDDAVAWVACAPLWVEYTTAEYTVQAGNDRQREPAPSKARLATRHVDPILRSLLGGGLVRRRYVISGDAIVVASTQNQQRAVAPLLTPAAVAHAGTATVHASLAPPLRLAVTARKDGKEIHAGLRRENVAFSAGSLTIYRLFLEAAVHLAYSRRLVERVGPSVVVVASNHDVAARALVRAAQERDVPSVLVPHAPMLADVRMRDAPTDYIAVRGERDLSWYLENGVEPDQIGVIGDPALEPAPHLVPIPKGAPIVFAPSPYEDEVVAAMVALVAAATDQDVVVAPHPRQRLEFLQGIAPRHWTFHSGRTYARLREGAAAVVQSSSGVALESLLLGIPVIEIEPLGGRAYPFLETDLVPSARTAEELAGHLELMRSRIVDRAYREHLVEYARGWCAASGETAAENTCRLVRRAAAEGKRARLAHDAWRPANVGSA